MRRYDHPQFTSSYNRLRGRSAGAAERLGPPRVEQRAVDPEYPYLPVHRGDFAGSVEDNAGRKREYFFHIPASVESPGNTVFVFASAGESARECFEGAGWRAILEKHRAAGIFVAPEGDWDRENPGGELDCFLRIYAEARNMEFFISNTNAQYALGFGTGAYMATLFSLLYSSLFAAFAVEGACDLDDDLLRLVGSLPSDGDPTVKKSRVPMPAWIVDRNGSGRAVAEYLKIACDAREEHLRNDVARVWRQGPRAGELGLNERAAAEVWYTGETEPPALSRLDLIERMLGFVVGFRRWYGTGNGQIRLSRSPKDMGLIRREMTVDGLKRYWYVFEPSSSTKGPREPYPLVVAIHGFSCSGGFYAENSNWVAVAEERNALAVFPTAYPYLRPHNRPTRITCPTPAWNSMPQVESAGPDDVKFIMEMLQVMKRDYPVDPARVYATGHSNGSVMTQLLMRQVPELFAAFGPIGGMENSFSGGKPAPQPNDLSRPVWYMMGEYDIGDADSLDEDKSNYQTVASLCECNRADYSSASRYSCGIYRHLVAYDRARLPLVRFTGIRGLPHTVTPETSLMLWDEFFCKFVRNPDGTIAYLG